MSWKKSVVCLLLTLCFTEIAMARPRGSRRQRAYYSYDVSSYGQTYDDEYAKLPTSSAIYDWDAIAKIDAVDYIPIILDKPLRGKLEVKLTCLNDSTKTYTIKTKLEKGRAKVRHKKIKPGTMYRLCVAINGKERIAGPYFTATSGDSPEARGRRQIIVRYFEQYWRKENGMSYYNTDCESGYRWAIQPYAKMPGFDSYGQNLAKFDKDRMIHGDKCANSSHTWMALAHDEQTGNIWCIDSNFNGTIMVILRQPGSWSVGHLTEDHFSQN